MENKSIKKFLVDKNLIVLAIVCFRHEVRQLFVSPKLIAVAMMNK